MTREEAIAMLKSKMDGSVDTSYEWAETVRMAIEALSDRPKGEWIEKYNGNGWNDYWDYTCSNCGKKYERADTVLYHAKYCPNCGSENERR